MNTDEIAVLFRRNELERREARRKRLVNEVKLMSESLSPEEKSHHERAVKEMQYHALLLKKDITPSYWKRLWHALLGR